MSDPLGTLLVVDDNNLSRQMLVKRLIRRNYDVKEAEDGFQALKMIESSEFDLVLLDVVMPGMSGLQVLKTIRKKYDRTTLPVIMATAMDESEDIVEALKEGANDYVTKPFDLDVLLARVGTHMLLKGMTDDLREANEQLERDLSAAARIQQSELPTSSPDIDGCQFAWAYEPCDQLAGDFLNVTKLDERHVVMYILDVSGHGVPAALLSVAVGRSLNPTQDTTCIVSKPLRKPHDLPPFPIQITPPSEVADKLNRRFPSNLLTGQYFTMIYGILDTQTGIFRFLASGHPPPLLVSAKGEVKFLESSGYPIGVAEPDDLTSIPNEENELTLKSGDRIYFYSDGIPEAGSLQRRPYGEERLASYLADTRSASLADSVKSLVEDARQWSGDAGFEDDVSLLAVELG